MSRKSRTKPQGGRPTLLTPDVHTSLIEATKMGSPMSVAAAYVGISERTFTRWMERGYNASVDEDEGKPVSEDDEPYLTLFKEVSEARATAAVRSVSLIQRAAAGGQITEETTKKYRDPETGSVVEEKTVKRTAPDWRAAAFYLERQHRQHFGKDKEVHMEITGANKGPLEVVGVEELANRVRDNIAAAAAALAGAQQQITDGSDIVDAEVEDAEEVADTGA